MEIIGQINALLYGKFYHLSKKSEVDKIGDVKNNVCEYIFHMMNTSKVEHIKKKIYISKIGTALICVVIFIVPSLRNIRSRNKTICE